jgi:hypothetical protein
MSIRHYVAGPGQLNKITEQFRTRLEPYVNEHAGRVDLARGTVSPTVTMGD